MTTPSNGERPQYLRTTFTDSAGDLPAICDALPTVIGAWTRQPSLEAKASENGLNQRYYTRTDGKRPLLALDLSRDGQIGEIVNIVPDAGQKEISMKEANRLEQDFVSALRPLLPSTVTVTQNAPTKHLRNLLTENTYNLFRHHSANKSTGNSHSNDRERWLQFVKAAAAEGLDDRDEHKDLVHAALLQEGFSDRHADQIAEDYVRHVEMAHAMM